MKEIASVLGVMAAALLLIGAAVFAGGDRSLFVPVPEAAAESFLREVATRRFDLALGYFTREGQRRETAQALERRWRPILDAVGTVNQVDGTPGWMVGDRAAATATMKGDRGSASCDVSFVRENGLWKITGVTVETR